MTTLYKLSATGAVQEWTIDIVTKDSLRIEWGQRNGLKQQKWEHVTINRSGRPIAQQVKSRFDSRVNKQLDSGYCYTIDEARARKNKNALNLHKPMLAQVYDPTKHIITSDSMHSLQYKYNGHRCLVTCNQGKLFAYSRNGKPIVTIGHILKGISIPEGVTLDGELYIHGEALQTISSIVKRVQEDNVKLFYIVYDQILPTRLFDFRYSKLYDYQLGLNCIIAPTKAVIGPESLIKEEVLQMRKDTGYEGWMIRSNDKGYEPGKRSSSLLKVKAWLDCEAEVVAILPSADGWAVLTCRLPNGKLFGVSAPGTMEKRAEILKNKEDYIGKLVTVEFADWTIDGIPFHPTAIAFREEE